MSGGFFFLFRNKGRVCEPRGGEPDHWESQLRAMMAEKEEMAKSSIMSGGFFLSLTNNKCRG